jgi:hypothetical protein
MKSNNGIGIPLSLVTSSIKGTHGACFSVKMGQCILNYATIARLAALRLGISWDEDAKVFYRWDENITAHMPLNKRHVPSLVRSYTQKLLMKEGAPRSGQSVSKRDLAEIITTLQATCPFPRPCSQNYFPAKNGVIRFGPAGIRKLSPRRCFGFKHVAIASYIKSQTPQKFLKLLDTVLPDMDDQKILIKYLGGAFTGNNPTRQMLLLRGPGGSSKSTILNVVEKLLAPWVADLRITHLGGRFEHSLYIGKRLLCAKDVPGNSLRISSAKLLKPLSGGDRLQAEQKFGGFASLVTTPFIVMTSNSELLLEPENDEQAWLDRVIVLDLTRPEYLNRIADYADVLIQKEGDAIISMFINAGAEFLAEVRQCGALQLSSEQKSRAENLVYASNSLRHFVQTRIHSAPNTSLSSSAVTLAYVQFCRQRGWKPVSLSVLRARLPDLMLYHHNAMRDTPVVENNRATIGYGNMSLKA